MVRVRSLTLDDLPEASRVLWKSYYAAENGKTDLEGMTTFRDLTEPLSLQMNAYQGDVLFYGAFKGDKMIAVGALKDRRHLLLLYVLPEEQRKGTGSRLLQRLLSMATVPDPTVNAAPDALPFYERHGFVPLSPLQVKDGIRFIPMIMKK